MKRDHGNEHDRGGGSLDGENQPNEPASQRALNVPKVPPIPFAGPAAAGPVAKSSLSLDDESQLSPVIQASDPTTSSPQTPARKRLEYPTDTSPTSGGVSGDLLREILVPVPEGVGLEDLNILSELCDDLLLTAEDAAEILETLDASSARQARSESWATTRTIARMRACIHSCVAQLNKGMCDLQSADAPTDVDTTSFPTTNHLSTSGTTHGSVTSKNVVATVQASAENSKIHSSPTPSATPSPVSTPQPTVPAGVMTRSKRAAQEDRSTDPEVSRTVNKST